MSTFTISIELGNAAMETGEDVALALRAIADRIYDREPLADRYAKFYDSGEPMPIVDANGNTVGGWHVSAESASEVEA